MVHFGSFVFSHESLRLSAVSRQVLATDSAFAALGVDGKVVTWGSKKGGDSSGVQEQLVEVGSFLRQ